jgi:hypothetical protein
LQAPYPVLADQISDSENKRNKPKKTVSLKGYTYQKMVYGQKNHDRGGNLVKSF